MGVKITGMTDRKE